MADLIDRINETATGPDHLSSNAPNELLRSAASEIARLRTELEAAKGDAVGEIERLREENETLLKHNARAHRERRRLWNMAEGLEPDDDEEGPRCRDCGDFDGRCQGDGLPCDPQQQAEELIRKMWPRRIRSALTADKSEAEVRQQEQIREDTLDGLYLDVMKSEGFWRDEDPVGPVLEFYGAMLPEERARSRAQEAKL